MLMTSTNDLILNISIVLFSISFAWMIHERCNKYPLLRRFILVHNYRRKFKETNEQIWNKKFKWHFKVVLYGWFFVFLWIIISTLSIICLNNIISGMDENLMIILIIFAPACYFFAPQMISSSITSLIVTRFSKDKKYLEKDEHFDLDKLDLTTSQTLDAHISLIITTGMGILLLFFPLIMIIVIDFLFNLL